MQRREVHRVRAIAVASLLLVALPVLSAAAQTAPQSYSLTSTNSGGR
jgi:hypothetical protein